MPMVVYTNVVTYYREYVQIYESNNV